MSKSRSIPTHPTRHRWTETDARSAVAGLAASGLTVYAFAQREGLDAQRLYRWRRRLGAAALEGPAVETTFVEVRPPANGPVEIVLRSGRVIRVTDSIDDRALLRLVELLEQDRAC